jgi:hypothetical protein
MSKQQIGIPPRGSGMTGTSATAKVVLIKLDFDLNAIKKIQTLPTTKMTKFRQLRNPRP